MMCREMLGTAVCEDPCYNIVVGCSIFRSVEPVKVLSSQT